MAIDQRLQALEDEHKVIRGEVKQTLENIRDFLLDLNLPAMQDEPIIGELHEHDEHHEEGSEGSPPPSPNSQPLPGQPSMMDIPTPEVAVPPPVGEQGGIPSVSQVTTIGPMPPQPRSLDSAQPPQPQPLDNIPSPSPLPPAPSEGLEAPETPQAPQGRMPLPREGTLPVDETGEAEIEEPELSLEEEAPFDEEEAWSSPENAVRSGEAELPVAEANPLQEEAGWPPPARPSRREQPWEDSREPAGRQPSPVNQLANLIRWVSRAGREIGIERMSAFLDVYCIGEPLSPEVRDVIMYLAERIAPVPAPMPTWKEPSLEAIADAAAAPEVPLAEALPAGPDADADVWSRLILELYGILGSGSASFRPQQLCWNRLDETGLPDEVAENTEMETVPPEDEAGATMPAPEGGPVAAVAEPAEAELNPPPDGGDEPLEIEVVKKKKTRNKKKRKSTGQPALSPDNRMARLKLVLPVNGSEEEEVSIGEFSLNISPVSK